MPMHSLLRDAARAPFTSAIALSAGFTSIWWWSGHNIERLGVSSLAFKSEPWRLVLSALPHLDPIHLAFNVYWWWIFGTRIERAWGQWRLAGLVILLAASSAAAQFAFSDPGVGLSGVGYGLFAMLYIAQRGVPAFHVAISPKTVQLFVAWFFLCVALTVGGIWQVGNVAHAVGALVGGLVGFCVIARPRMRRVWVGSMVVVLVLVGGAATVGRPWLNRSTAITESLYLGSKALEAGRLNEAVTLLETAVAERPGSAAARVNLGIAYQGLGRNADALKMYKRAIELDTSTRPSLAPAIASILQSDASDAVQREDYPAALALIGESLQWNDDSYSWELLASIYAATGDEAGAAKALSRSRERDGK